MGRPKVFVVEEPKASIDLSKAEAYGEVHFIFAPADSRCSVFHCTKFGRRVLEQLERHKYDPNVDFLCLAGSVAPLIVTAMVVMAKWTTIRLLFYDVGSSRYISRLVKAESWMEAPPTS